MPACLLHDLSMDNLFPFYPLAPSKYPKTVEGEIAQQFEIYI